jgi:hypothetical protein
MPILLVGGALGIVAQCIRTSYFWCSNRYWFQLFAFCKQSHWLTWKRVLP